MGVSVSSFLNSLCTSSIVVIGRHPVVEKSERGDAAAGHMGHMEEQPYRQNGRGGRAH
jgi:hypothetical protein